MRRTILSLAVLGGLWLGDAAPSASAADFKVIVNASNAVGSLATSALQRLFLKKDTRWTSGEAVEPVDQSVKSAVRAAFTSQVHAKDVGAVKSYWQKQIFSGRGTPPPEMPSDAEVLAYVRSHVGAVGYVASDAAVGDGVKVVRLTD